tara:strand:+ start:152 stop:349 length:198 start_codon:yes stop_codon:yes gene_type:complete
MLRNRGLKMDEPNKSIAVEALPKQPDSTKRLGFLIGHTSVPDDFDTMHQKPIEELFQPTQNPPAT